MEPYDIASQAVGRFGDARPIGPRRMVIMSVDEARTKVQREPRRQLHKRPTWMTLDDGMTKIECFLLDVSPGGAKIVTDAAIDVRDSFLLALVPEHPTRQSCEVVWRRGRTYGIKFLS
jgi:hypothetical protein